MTKNSSSPTTTLFAAATMASSSSTDAITPESSHLWKQQQQQQQQERCFTSSATSTTTTTTTLEEPKQQRARAPLVVTTTRVLAKDADDNAKVNDDHHDHPSTVQFLPQEHVQVKSPACDSQIKRIVAKLCPELVMLRNQDHSNNASHREEEEKEEELDKPVVVEGNETAIVGDLYPELHVRPLTGGLSNLLFVVSSSSVPVTESSSADRSVLVRVHPDASSSSSSDDDAATVTDLVNRHAETMLVEWLSCHNSSTGAAASSQSHSHPLVPRTLGRFANGRIEQFYAQHVPSSWNDLLSVHGPAVARLLADIHGRTSTVPEALRQALEQPPALPEQQQQQPAPTAAGDCFDRTSHWLRLAQQIVENKKKKEAKKKSASAAPREQPQQDTDSKNDDDDTAATSTPDDDDPQQQQDDHELAAVQDLVQTLEREWAWTCQAFAQRNNNNNNSNSSAAENEARQFAATVVLNHGDCQSLNVLVPAQTLTTSTTTTMDGADSRNDNHVENDILLIDYEYANFSPRAWDLANTVCECANANNLQANWATEYPTKDHLLAFLQAYCEALHVQQQQQQQQPTKHVQPTIHADFLEALAAEVGRYTLLSHMQWAIWSIVNWEQSDVADFDYIAYAQQRLQGFYHHRQQFWPEITTKTKTTAETTF